jgi:hypothetical protein
LKSKVPLLVKAQTLPCTSKLLPVGVFASVTRIEVLKDLGETEVICLVSTDDEGFTYNRRVNRLAIIQEHKMILKAIARGAPEKRIAAALNIDVSTLRHKVRLLDGNKVFIECGP